MKLLCVAISFCVSLVVFVTCAQATPNTRSFQADDYFGIEDIPNIEKITIIWNKLDRNYVTVKDENGRVVRLTQAYTVRRPKGRFWEGLDS